MAVECKLGFDNQLLTYIEWGQVDKAKLMLNTHLAKKYDGAYTLLHYATIWNNDDIVKYLITLGADIDSLDIDNKTPLMLAIQYGHRQIVKTLSSAKANLELINDTGITALQLAFDVKYQDSEILDIFLARLQKETDNIEELVDKLMNAGCTLNQALYSRNVQVIEVMLKRGVDVNSRDYWKGTALQIATRMQEVTLMKLLLDHGARVNTPDMFGLNPLLTASCSRNKEMIKILLEARANPNVRTYHQRYTPLWLIFNYMENTAVEETDECIELLFQYGAIPENPRQLLDIASKNRKSIKKTFMLINYLAILKQLGTKIQNVDLHIEKEQLNSDLLVLFQSCEDFLKRIIFKKLSILELLTDSETKMKTYVRNGGLMSKVQNLLSNNENKKLFPYYCSTLTKRILKARRAVGWEETSLEL